MCSQKTDNSNNKCDLGKLAETCKGLLDSDIEVDRPFVEEPFGVNSNRTPEDPVLPAPDNSKDSFSGFIMDVNNLKKPEENNRKFVTASIFVFLLAGFLVALICCSICHSGSMGRTNLTCQHIDKSNTVDSSWTCKDTVFPAVKKKCETKPETKVTDRQGCAHNRHNDVSCSKWTYDWPMLLIIIALIIAVTVIVCLYLRYVRKKSDLDYEREKSFQDYQQKLISEFVDVQLDRERSQITMNEKNFLHGLQRAQFPMDMRQREQDYYWKYKAKHLDIKNDVVRSLCVAVKSAH